MCPRFLIISTKPNKPNKLLPREKEEEPRKPTMQEAFLSPFVLNLDMIHLQKKPRINARFMCKTFAATGPSGGTSTRAFQIGSGQCSLPSTHHTSTLLLCVVSTLKKIVIHTI